MQITFVLVGMTGFEPATTRPPAECATRLRHIPDQDGKITKFDEIGSISAEYIYQLKCQNVHLIISVILMSHI